MSISQLKFVETTGGVVILSLIAVMVTAGFCFVGWRRSGHRPSPGLLGLLRPAIVGLAAPLFNQPEWGGG